MRHIIFCFMAVSLLAACGPQNMYEWGSYEYRLYGYYKDPEQLEELMTALRTTIEDGESASKESGKSTSGGDKTRRIAPGLYAEYGYLLLIKNKGSDAKRYFQKEKESWPESTVLMDKMIKAVDGDAGGWTRSGVFQEKGAAK